MKKDTFNKKQLHQLSALCKEGKRGSQLDKDLWNLRYLRYSVLFGSFEYQSGIIATLDRAIRKLEEEKKMKIIKEGTIPSTTKRFTCNNCGCIFECDASEYRRETVSRNITYYEAVCPTCGMKLYIYGEIRNAIKSMKE